MGNYVNPGNEGFTVIRNGTYVDKTGLIRLVNQTIDTPRRSGRRMISRICRGNI